MTSLEALKIDLLHVTIEGETVRCILDNDFFQSLDVSDIHGGNVSATLLIRKATAGSFTLTLEFEGDVTVSCDLCLDDMSQPVVGSVVYDVVLGEEDSDDGETIVVSERNGVLDASWLVYEAIALAVPIKHVHAPGKCNAAMTEKLQALSATRSGDEASESDIDPRWADLIKLK